MQCIGLASMHPWMKSKIFMGVVAVGQGCCEASLQSNTEQCQSYSVLTSAAVHWSCINALLDEEQISIGVVAVAQGCCEPVLQSNTEQWESYCALSSDAVHWSCINAHLDEEQISTGVVVFSMPCPYG